MTDFKHIKLLQVEATSRCNAWCPGCARNVDGYTLIDNFTPTDLTPQRFTEIVEQFTIDTIDFCGTYGDAVVHPDLFSLITVAKQHSRKILLRSNASMRNTDWWASFARLLSDHPHEVWFCLDGTDQSTHSRYRQATDYDRIISNAQSFIAAGGHAVWQFIPFAHNEHQIKDAMRLSQQLGFKRFEFYKDVRVDFRARDYRTGQPIEILPWSRNPHFSKYEQTRTVVTAQSCRHVADPQLYVNADGTLSHCCFFNTTKTFNTVEVMPDITKTFDKPHPICVKYCGVKT